MSARFVYAKQLWLEGQVAWLTDATRIMMIDHAVHTPNPAVDQFFADIPALARVGNGGGSTRASMPLLINKTSLLGVADADDADFTAVTAGSPLHSAVIFKDTGVDGTSPLLILDNTALGLPVYRNGGPVRWAFNAAGIYAE